MWGPLSALLEASCDFQQQENLPVLFGKAEMGLKGSETLRLKNPARGHGDCAPSGTAPATAVQIPALGSNSGDSSFPIFI